MPWDTRFFFFLINRGLFESHETNPEVSCDFFQRRSVKRNLGSPCWEAGVLTVCGQESGLSDAGPWGKMCACRRLDPRALARWASAVKTATG